MEAVLDTFDQKADVHWSVFPNPPACPKLSADVRPIAKQNGSFLAKRTGSRSDSKSFLATKMHVSDDVWWKRNLYPVCVKRANGEDFLQLLWDEDLFLFGHWGKQAWRFLYCNFLILYFGKSHGSERNIQNSWALIHILFWIQPP